MKHDLTEAEIKSILRAPNGSETLYKAHDPELMVPRVFPLITADCAVQAMAYLSRAAKSKRPRAQINALLDKTDRTVLHNALTSNDPKLRKNAAKLMGALMDEHDAEPLISALSCETTLFVIPSLILALGSLAENSPAACDALLSFTPPESEPEQARLIRDIEESLAKARSKFIKRESHSFSGFDSEHTIELLYPEGLGAGLMYELGTAAGITPVSRSKSSVLVSASDYAALFRMRSFTEALFPVLTASGELTRQTLDYKELANDARKMLCDLMRFHSGEPPYAYRIENRLPRADRKAAARAFSEVLDADGMFQNATTGYELELRISGDEACHTLYVKLFTFPDTRFSYRLSDVPASINPATAAALLGSARDAMHYTEGARVLDITCGSGTLLIERERLCGAGRPSELLGLDISRRAIDAAETNAKAADSRAHFLHTDCLKYSVKPNERYHEVIANLPFGNRVGNHENNRTLYEGIARKLPEWLLPNGTALLYTADKRLLFRIVQRPDSKLKLLKEIKTVSGGLSPSGFVLKLKS